MSFGGRAPPGPAGGTYSAPQTPSCIETPRVFGARSRLTPSDNDDDDDCRFVKRITQDASTALRVPVFFSIRKQTIPVLLFPIRTLKRAPRLTLVWGPRMVNPALVLIRNRIKLCESAHSWLTKIWIFSSKCQAAHRHKSNVTEMAWKWNQTLPKTAIVDLWTLKSSPRQSILILATSAWHGMVVEVVMVS